MNQQQTPPWRNTNNNNQQQVQPSSTGNNESSQNAPPVVNATWRPPNTQPPLRPLLQMGTSYLPGDMAERRQEAERKQREQRASSTVQWSVAQLRAGDAVIPAQSGSNRFASQRGMSSFGAPRDVVGAEPLD